MENVCEMQFAAHNLSSILETSFLQPVNGIMIEGKAPARLQVRWDACKWKFPPAIVVCTLAVASDRFSLQISTCFSAFAPTLTRHNFAKIRLLALPMQRLIHKRPPYMETWRHCLPLRPLRKPLDENSEKVICVNLLHVCLVVSVTSDACKRQQSVCM